MDILLKHEDCMLLETFCENLSEECIEAELSMPEYMPDILRIVKSTAEIKTSTCRITGDKASVDGVCEMKMIYTAEDGGIYCFTLERPFTRYCEKSDFSECVDVTVKTDVAYVNCRATSSKRAEFKVGLNINVTGHKTKNQDILSLPESNNIEEKCVPVRCASLGCRKTRSFVMSDTMQLDVPSAFVISNNATAICNDIKKINNKIMIKGDAVVDICYVNAENKSQTTHIKHNLPINQILDFDGMEEQFFGEIVLTVTAIEVFQRNESDGYCTSFDISLGIDATATMWEEKELLIITDAYSVNSCIDLKKQKYSFLCTPEYIKDTYLHKDSIVLSAGDIVDIVDLTCKITRCDVKIDNGCLAFYGTVSLSILARDSSGNITNHNKVLDYRYEKNKIDYTKNFKCMPDIKITSVDYNKKSEKDIDIRIEMRIFAEVFECLTLDTVTDITESEIQVKKERKAITVYFPEKEESLWSIARRYNTTVNAIAQENNLEGETTEDLKIVFIPAV